MSKIKMAWLGEVMERDVALAEIQAAYKRGYENAVREVADHIEREGGVSWGDAAIEIRRVFLSAPAEPPADDWCKCPIKTRGKITLTYHPIGGHAAPLLDGFRCQHCDRRVEAFHNAPPAEPPAAEVCEWEWIDGPYAEHGSEGEWNCSHGGPSWLDPFFPQQIPPRHPRFCPDCGLPVRIKPAKGEDT